MNILLSPDPYPHWTIRECLEQPEAIARALAFGGRMSDTRVFLGGLDRQKERMRGIQHMVRACVRASGDRSIDHRAVCVCVCDVVPAALASSLRACVRACL